MKRSRVLVPLAVEIYFSSGYISPTPNIEQKVYLRVLQRGHKAVGPGEPFNISLSASWSFLVSGSFPVNQYTEKKKEKNVYFQLSFDFQGALSFDNRYGFFLI